MLHTLTYLPESQDEITNYTCVAQNSLGQGRASVSLTGSNNAASSHLKRSLVSRQKKLQTY